MSANILVHKLVFTGQKAEAPESCLKVIQQHPVSSGGVVLIVTVSWWEADSKYLPL